jgi:hypothetical protein
VSSTVLALIDEAVADWATSVDAMRHVPGLPPSGPVPPTWVDPSAGRAQVAREEVAREEWRNAVYGWLVANGLGEPGGCVWVPVDARAWIEQGRWIVCEVYQTRDGQIALDEGSDYVPPYMTIVAPMLVPPKDPRVWVWLGRPRGLPPSLGRRVKRRGGR